MDDDKINAEKVNEFYGKLVGKWALKLAEKEKGIEAKTTRHTVTSVLN